MSLLASIFGPGDPTPPQFPDPETCPHARLMGRYPNRTAQLEERPMGYKCQRCLREFLPSDPVVKRWRAQHTAGQTAAPEASDN